MGTPWRGERATLGTLATNWHAWSNNASQQRSLLRSPASATRLPSASGHRLAFGEYLSSELGWGKGLDWTGTRGRTDHVINFLRVPLQLEPFLALGHAICVDLFLFHFTFLPLRFFVALGQGLYVLARRAVAPQQGGTGAAPPLPTTFHRGHAYDLIRGALVLISVWALGAVQVSRVYHYIRGEAIIKLYVIFNILEIFDKLACSLGQDVLDALYRTIRDQLGGPSGAPVVSLTGGVQTGFHFAVAVAYTVAHSLILFVQIVCLNVAINSRNNALLTLLISNNFVELKASVFKRFEAENLFQVSCADVVERFQLSLFLGLIAMQEFSTTTMVLALLPSMVAIYLCEVVVDYLKHSFIGKFNRLHSDLYSTFGCILSHDILRTRATLSSSLDPTHIGVKRLGLPTIPLTVVVCRIILLKVAPVAFPRFGTGHLVGVLVYALAALCLLAAKTLLGMLLTAVAAKKILANHRAQLDPESFNRKL